MKSFTCNNLLFVHVRIIDTFKCWSQHATHVLFKLSFIQSYFDEKFLSGSNSNLPHSDQVVSVASKQGL